MVKQVKKGSALTTCKDCSGKVSINASTCPHCGAPLKEKPTPVVVAQDVTRGITRPLSPVMAFFGGILLGPFVYIYVRRYDLMIIWLIVGIILLFVTMGVAAPVLWIIWGAHAYSICNKINLELEKRQS